MSFQLTVHPWRSHNELIDVRAKLFPDRDENTSEDWTKRYDISNYTETKEDRKTFNVGRRLAINMIQTWACRGSVPHPIAATALLVDALLTHYEFGTSSSGYVNGPIQSEQTMQLPPFAARAMFATAISRFVTGFCDVGHGGSLKRSMYDVAADIGMSEEWVAMRHEITHGEMPGMLEMKNVAQDALDWLWKGYWKQLKATTSGNEHATFLTDRLKSGLKALFKRRKDAIKSKEKNFPIGEYDPILKLIAREIEATDIIVNVLIAEKLLLPNTNTTELNMKAAFLIWHEPLNHFMNRSFSFYTQLLTALQDRLLDLSSTLEAHISEGNAVLEWIVNLLTNKNWSISEAVRQDALDEVMEFCLLNMSLATAKLSGQLLSQRDPDFRSTWARLCENAMLAAAIAPLDENIFLSNNSSEVQASSSSSSYSEEQGISDRDGESTAGGWKLLQGVWTPRPIGVLHITERI
jgi:ribosomal biogenesis protein LAS1